MKRVIAVLLVCHGALSLAGEVYRNVGPDGKVTYSDQPPTTNSSEISKDIRQRDPALRVDPVRAAINVYTKEIIVHTASNFCAKEVPQSASRVAAASDEWMRRHAVT